MGKISAPLFNANPEQINVHLSRLFSRCADEYPGGMFEIRCIHPGTKAVKAQLFDTTPEGFDKGTAWAVEMNAGKGGRLYAKDGSHPSAEGVKLSAEVFVEFFYGK